MTEKPAAVGYFVYPDPRGCESALPATDDPPAGIVAGVESRFTCRSGRSGPDLRQAWL